MNPSEKIYNYSFDKVKSTLVGVLKEKKAVISYIRNHKGIMTVDESPSNLGGFKVKILDSLAAFKDGQIESSEAEQLFYNFPEIKRELEDVKRFRENADLSQYNIGKTIFDSGQ